MALLNLALNVFHLCTGLWMVYLLMPMSKTKQSELLCKYRQLAHSNPGLFELFNHKPKHSLVLCEGMRCITTTKKTNANIRAKQYKRNNDRSNKCQINQQVNIYSCQKMDLSENKYMIYLAPLINLSWYSIIVKTQSENN